MNKLTEIMKDLSDVKEFNVSEVDANDYYNDVEYLLSLLEEKDKALAFYADEENWHYDKSGDGMIGDGGDIARKALNTSSNNEGD
ncbi:hypothetical protein D3C81_173640 [compost metagenome]